MKENSRQLTPKEQQRKERFDRLSAELTQQGYQAENLTVGIVRANVLAVVIMLPAALAALVLFWYFQGDGILTTDPDSFFRKWLAMMLGLIVSVVVHEGIHGLVWGLCTGFRNIEFGVIWKMLTPYCACTQPMARWQYVLGAVMPTLILSVIPLVFSILHGSLVAFFLGEVMLFGGGGDVLIVGKVLLHSVKGGERLYCDHPSQCGAVVFWR